MTLPYPKPFMDITTLAEHTCLSESTIENHVRLGIFPAPRMQGGKRLWRWKTVEKFLAGEDDDVPISPDAQAEKITEATRKAVRA
jgi:predicted DNA-binding transcriptional regulator AlpA